MKIGIGLPTDDMMDVDCVISLFNLDHGEHKFTVFNQRGCYIDASRNTLVRECQKAEMDYILFIDSDMAFPADSFLKLIAANVDIIGCNYAKRRPPHGPMATGMDGKLVDPLQKGFNQVMAVGTGFLLINMKVFDTMQFPWFDCKWNPEGIQFGEDVRFCAKAWSVHKIPVYCHHEASMQMVHIGQFPYKIEMFLGDNANGDGNIKNEGS